MYYIPRDALVKGADCQLAPNILPHAGANIPFRNFLRGLMCAGKIENTCIADVVSRTSQLRTDFWSLTLGSVSS